MDANDWFANANRLGKPRERQNLFGGVLGGPLYLPRFGEGGPALFSGKNRLFFFASYEGLRLEQPKVQVVTVPTATTRAQAIGGLAPYLNALPLPNGQDFGNGTAQFAAGYSNPGAFNVFAFRLDGQVTENLTSFFRFSHAPSESKTRIDLLSTISSTRVVNNSYTGGLTWIASSRLTADLRFNWTRNSGRFVNALDTFGGGVVPQPSGIFLQPGRNPSNASFAFNAVSDISFEWGVGSLDTQRQFNAVGTVAWLVGSHQVKFGMDYRRSLPLIGGIGGTIEQLFFNAPEDLKSGTALLYIVGVSDPAPRRPIIPALSFFAQDAWRVNSRLTLTYGLRFERVPSPGEATGRLPRTALGIENDVLQNPRLAPQGTPLFRKAASGFAPRFGVAYQLGVQQGFETTLRGGVGIFYDLPLGVIASQFADGVYPFGAVKTVCCDISYPLSAADRAAPSLPGNPADLSGLFFLDPNIRLPYTTEWNTSWEQGLGHAQRLTASYVGAVGRRLLTMQFYRQALTDFAGTQFLRVQRNRSSSNYQAMQLQFQRGLSRGLQALVSYTLGRSRDDASDDSAFVPPASQAQLFAKEYGPSNFDVRHVFSSAVTYDLPKFSGSVLLRALFNGWGSDLLVRYQSSFPFSPSGRAGVVIDRVNFTARPNLVPGQSLYIYDSALPGGRRWNPAAFTRAPAGQQGDFPRNGLRGFSASQVDLALRREFKLGERVRLQCRGELFNLLNHPNFGAPEANIGSGQFGKPNSMLSQSLGGLNALYQMGGPRSGQLAIKILF
jgi:hypothetical protein